MKKRFAIKRLASHLGCDAKVLVVEGATHLGKLNGWDIRLGGPDGKAGEYRVTKHLGVQKLN